MRALILCLALAACGLQAQDPYIGCPEGDRLIRSTTLDGDVIETCVPIPADDVDEIAA